jgi:hypothetical protein
MRDGRRGEPRISPRSTRATLAGYARSKSNAPTTSSSSIVNFPHFGLEFKHPQ